MADLTVTPASVVQSTAAQPRRGVAGATILAGKVLYQDTDKSLKLADANAGSAGDAIRKVKGVALNGASATQVVNFVEADSDFTPGATLTAGVPYFLSATAGGICPLADVPSGATVTFIGIAKDSTKLRLAPAEGGTLA